MPDQRSVKPNLKAAYSWIFHDTNSSFLLFFLLPDWLKLNHLKCRMECGFSDIFSRHICSTVAETIGVTNYAASFGAKNVQKTTFEAAEMILGPWNQQPSLESNLLSFIHLVMKADKYSIKRIVHVWKNRET